MSEGVSEVAELFKRAADEAGAQARPPALDVLRRRRARRSAARAGAGAAALAGVAAAVVLVPWAPTSAPDVVVADAPPSAAPPAVRVPEGKVAVPPWAAGQLRLPSTAAALADRLSSHPTEDGPLVTAGHRDGDRLCWAVFTAGDPTGPAGGSSCDALTLPAYRAGGLDLGAASEGRSAGGPVGWLVLTGSAPAGTETVVLTPSGGEPERVAVSSAGPAYLDRAFFALPWVQQDTVVEALDADGRVLTSEEVLLAMGQPPG